MVINGCLKGHPASQKKLFEYHYSYVKSICLRYGGSYHEAEEMLNDTFYKVFRYLDRYDQKRVFLPWLAKVCVNACLEYNRKYLKKIKLEEHIDNIQEKWEEELDSTIDIPTVLRSLSPAYRTIFNLYVIEEYKHQEIAEMLGISVNTSKSNLSRAKEKLRKHLSDFRTSSKLKFL